MVLWVIAGVGLLLALAALSWSRRLSRKLDSLTQSYWDLRYDYTRLRSQVARLDPDRPDDAVPPPPAESVTFVPLSAVKKRM